MCTLLLAVGGNVKCTSKRKKHSLFLMCADPRLMEDTFCLWSPITQLTALIDIWSPHLSLSLSLSLHSLNIYISDISVHPSHSIQKVHPAKAPTTCSSVQLTTHGAAKTGLSLLREENFPFEMEFIYTWVVLKSERGEKKKERKISN